MFMKKLFVGVVFGLVSLVFLSPAAHASYSQDFTVYAVANGGTAYNQTPFVQFVLDSNPGTILASNGTILGQVGTPFNSWTIATGSNSVEKYTTVTNPINNWTLQSAGNVWNSSSPIYVTTGALAAGTYRISPTLGTNTFMYDFWDWSSSAIEGHYGWLMQITDNHGNHYTLGNGSGGWAATDTNEANLINSIRSLYLDLTVTAGTQLYFWIYDVNALDNEGSLSVNVASVPLPSSLLLVLGGLPAMALFRVRRFFSKK